jgi:hypothetical protein
MAVSAADAFACGSPSSVVMQPNKHDGVREKLRLAMARREPVNSG